LERTVCGHFDYKYVNIELGNQKITEHLSKKVGVKIKSSLLSKLSKRTLKERDKGDRIRSWKKLTYCPANCKELSMVKQLEVKRNNSTKQLECSIKGIQSWKSE